MLGIKPHRHRRTSAEAGEYQIVRARSGVEPANDRFVNKKSVRSTYDFLLEFSVAGFAHKNSADFDLLVATVHRLLKVPLGPGGDHIGHIDRIAIFAQQMIAPASDTKLLGCLAVVKIREAFSIPTILSVGE